MQCRDDVDETSVECRISSGVLCEEDKEDRVPGASPKPSMSARCRREDRRRRDRKRIERLLLHVGTFGTGKNLDMVEDGAISHAIRLADRGTLRV